MAFCNCFRCRPLIKTWSDSKFDSSNRSWKPGRELLAETLPKVRFERIRKLEQFIEGIASWASVLVPLLAVWAIVGLYTQKAGCQCIATQILYFSMLLFVAGLTIRTVMIDDECLLVHTSTLGMMVVSGVMRRPNSVTPDYFGESLSA